MTRTTAAKSPLATKVKKTLSLDPDVVEQIVGDEKDGNLSGLVNALLIDEVARRQRKLALRAILEELEAELGPADEALIARYASMLR